MMSTIILGLTGASGGVYFLRLLEILAARAVTLRVIATEQGEKVLAHETGIELRRWLALRQNDTADIIMEDNQNLFSPAASGSHICDAMAVCPCSMSTLGELAHGSGKTLLTRTADVMLKERRRLVLVPRETPLSPIHLENMLRLSRCGAILLPAMPGFYQRPQTMEELVDFIVGKTLDALGLENNCYERWEGTS